MNFFGNVYIYQYFADGAAQISSSGAWSGSGHEYYDESGTPLNAVLTSKYFVVTFPNTLAITTGTTGITTTTVPGALALYAYWETYNLSPSGWGYAEAANIHLPKTIVFKVQQP